MTAQRRLTISIELLLNLFGEPGDVGRMFTIMRDALPDDATVAAAEIVGDPFQDGRPGSLVLVIESDRWMGNEPVDLSPWCAVSYDTDHASVRSRD